MNYGALRYYVLLVLSFSMAQYTGYYLVMTGYGLMVRRMSPGA